MNLLPFARPIFTLMMQLSTPDWIIVVAFFTLSLAIGLRVSRKSGKNTGEYFLSGRNMSWWLLGISMVATTFSADTPNLVTDIVRNHGVSGNWMWWAFLLTGMLTVFVYAHLWRRSGVQTDLGFYEMRYSGKAAAFLRGFRAVYLGLFFNVFIMATVMLAAIKIGNALLGLQPWQTIAIAGSVTVVYTALGGLRGVIWTDLVQFALAMTGSIWAAVYIIRQPEIGGLGNLLSHPNVSGKLQLIPDFSDLNVLLPLFIIPLAVQWWSVWYPGAEPGGGGYIAQRMLAAKNEKHATGATLLFNLAHYAIRPWPWILIALASLVIYPDLEQLGIHFSSLDKQFIRDDLAYPAMLGMLPPVLLGLVFTSLAAAFMSTLSTHLNWGASYMVHDVFQRFMKPSAGEKELVWQGRLATVVLIVLAALLALQFENAMQTFNILLQIGAGTGLLYILRWFWWRINPYSEITAMVVSLLVAIYFEWFHHGVFGFSVMPDHLKLVSGVLITTVCWLTVTLLTPADDMQTLSRFYRKIGPFAAGWKPVIQSMTGDDHPQRAEESDMRNGAAESRLGIQLACMILGCFAVYSFLFGTGYLLYGSITNFLISLIVFIISATSLMLAAQKLRFHVN